MLIENHIVPIGPQNLGQIKRMNGTLKEILTKCWGKKGRGNLLPLAFLKVKCTLY